MMFQDILWFKNFTFRIKLALTNKQLFPRAQNVIAFLESIFPLVFSVDVMSSKMKSFSLVLDLNPK